MLRTEFRTSPPHRRNTLHILAEYTNPRTGRTVEADPRVLVRYSHFFAYMLLILISSRISFVYNLDPSFRGNPAWPQYGTAQNTLQLAAAKTFVVEDSYRKAGTECVPLHPPLSALSIAAELIPPTQLHHLGCEFIPTARISELGPKYL